MYRQSSLPKRRNPVAHALRYHRGGPHRNRPSRAQLKQALRQEILWYFEELPLQTSRGGSVAAAGSVPFIHPYGTVWSIPGPSPCPLITVRARC